MFAPIVHLALFHLSSFCVNGLESDIAMKSGISGINFQLNRTDNNPTNPDNADVHSQGTPQSSIFTNSNSLLTLYVGKIVAGGGDGRSSHDSNKYRKQY